MRLIAAALIALAALTTAASADTLSLSVSPSTAVVSSPLSVTASGSASLGDDLKVFIEGAEASSSPGTCREGNDYGYGEAEPVPPLPHTFTYQAPESPGAYRACGYLLSEHVDERDSVDAVAETRFTVIDHAEAEAAERAQTEAREVAELEAAKRHALETPVSELSVRAVSRPGASSQRPGETELVVKSEPFAHITLSLTRHGRRVEAFDLATSSLTATSAEVDIPVAWSCRSPGGVYHYAISARSDVGPTLTRSGRFSPVSAARCRALKHSEAEARQRNARRYAESVRHRERAEREALEQWEGNCRALGGTPVTLHTSEGAERACRAPDGGRLRVP